MAFARALVPGPEVPDQIAVCSHDVEGAGHAPTEHDGALTGRIARSSARERVEKVAVVRDLMPAAELQSRHARSPLAGSSFANANASFRSTHARRRA